MKIYTRTGDDGTTGLFGGVRVPKSGARVEAYGTVDELNAAIGCVRANGPSVRMAAMLEEVQSDLFVLGAELACAPGKEDKLKMRLLEDADCTRLEGFIDTLEASLPQLQSFVLPGGSTGSAYLHLARTICRRAERTVLSLGDSPARASIQVYLNRLSDLLFVMARFENQETGHPDVPWVPRR